MTFIHGLNCSSISDVFTNIYHHFLIDLSQRTSRTSWKSVQSLQVMIESSFNDLSHDVSTLSFAFWPLHQCDGSKIRSLDCRPPGESC